MKKIDIYIDTTQKKEIENTKNKYRKSLSCLVDIISIELWEHFKNFEGKNQKLIDLNLVQNRKNTKIHLTKNNYLQTLEQKNLRKILTNSLYLYISKKWEFIDLDKKEMGNVINKINQKLMNVNDPYWNLNEQIRIQKRAQSILSKGKKNE